MDMISIRAGQFSADRQEARALLNLSENVYQLRKRNGLTQTDLAKKIGTTQSAISEIETPLTNSATLNLLGRLADALGVTIVDLISKPRQNYTPMLITTAHFEDLVK